MKETVIFSKALIFIVLQTQSYTFAESVFVLPLRNIGV